MVYETYSPQETFDIGKRMGEEALPGTVITLDGDLGAGKTLFTKGFAEGLGVREVVNSPTFTILQQYFSGRLPLHHFDLYRIEEEEELFEIGLDECLTGDGVCLIEWADRFPDMIPRDATRIRIEKDPEQGFDFRRITVTE